jgi:hypothetical protein
MGFEYNTSYTGYSFSRGARGRVVNVVDLKSLASLTTATSDFLSAKSLQLAYGTFVDLLRCPSVPERMYSGKPEVFLYQSSLEVAI